MLMITNHSLTSIVLGYLLVICRLGSALAFFQQHISSSSSKPLLTRGPPSLLVATTPQPNTEIPKWAGGGFLSDVVNGLISVKPLFAMMKIAAKLRYIYTAEQHGIPWTASMAHYKANMNTLERYYNEMFNSHTQPYPTYYTQQFHAYDKGNLEYAAAIECESATYATSLHVWQEEKDLTGPEAHSRLRKNFVQLIQNYARQHSLRIDRFLDGACSVGMSTQALVDGFPEARQMEALDLSPHFLAVAKYRQEVEHKLSSKVHLSHQAMENTNFVDNSFNLVAMTFLFHELPDEAARNILKEAYRIAQRGKGMVAIFDIDPDCEAARRMPPPIFTIMKATEPWTDQYYRFDLAQAMRDVGFVDVEYIITDPRHRTLLGRKP
eukprot:gene7232-8001_t